MLLKFFPCSRRFWLANKLPYPLVSSILVDQSNRGTEFDYNNGKLRHVDNFRTREFVFKLGNASLIDFLLCFGSLIFRILGQI